MVKNTFPFLLSVFLGAITMPSMVWADHHEEHTEVVADHHETTEGHHEEEHASFDPVSVIMGHVKDANEWHLWSTTDAEGYEHHVSIPLPVIIWDGALKVFMSSHIAHGHIYEGYTMHHGALVSTEGLQKATLFDLFSEGVFYDFSITKNVFAMILSAILIFVIFTIAARSYAKNNGIPKGIAGFMEPIVLFIKDEVALPNIGKEKHEKYLPYLLTVFFFIWINNLLGLLPFFPGGANVTGNIAVTMVLALLTLIIVSVSGNKSYWQHIFLPPVPKLLYPIMVPIELIGVLTKPFSLMIRLFANITAGHIIILSLISLIFIMKSVFISPVSIGLGLFMNLLELLVAILQAYIFTLLTALYIGQAVKDHH